MIYMNHCDLKSIIYSIILSNISKVLFGISSTKKSFLMKANKTKFDEMIQFFNSFLIDEYSLSKLFFNNYKLSFHMLFMKLE